MIGNYGNRLEGSSDSNIDFDTHRDTFRETRDSNSTRSSSIIDYQDGYGHVSQPQQIFFIAKEMCRQAAMVAKATELRLEVEVRRTYTTLHCETLNGESTKSRNNLFGIEEFMRNLDRFNQSFSPNWFELAEKLLTRNEVAKEVGYPTISNLKTLTDAYNSAKKAKETLRSYEWKLTAYIDW